MTTIQLTQKGKEIYGDYEIGLEYIESIDGILDPVEIYTKKTRHLDIRHSNIYTCYNNTRCNNYKYNRNKINDNINNQKSRKTNT